jgi:tetratricopeptide (TPR) repeat protein
MGISRSRNERSTPGPVDPPAGRRFRLRRGPVALAALAIVLIGVVVALVVAVGGMRRARRALAEQVDETERVRLVTGFLCDMLGAADPAVSGHEPTLGELLDRGVARLDAGFTRDADVEASIRLAIGRSLVTIGRFTDGLAQIDAAYRARVRMYGDFHTGTASALSAKAWALNFAGLHEQAEPLARRAVDLAHYYFRDDHEESLMAVRTLAQALGARPDKRGEAEDLLRTALEIARRAQGRRAPITSDLTADLAGLLCVRHGFAEAEPLQRWLLDRAREPARDPSSPALLMRMHELGMTLTAVGRLEEAEPLIRGSLDGRRERLGPDHPLTWTGVHALGLLLEARGDLAGAEEQLGAFAPAASRLWGGASGAAVGASVDLVRIRLARRTVAADQAEGILAAALGSAPGAADAGIRAWWSVTYAVALAQAGKLDQARRVAIDAETALRAAYGPGDPWTLRAGAAMREVEQAASTGTSPGSPPPASTPEHPR